jgi:hypothetical protein
MRKKPKDERIVKETNKVIAPLYLLMLILTCVAVAAKYIFLTHQIINYILELIALIGSIGYLLVRSKLNGIQIFSSKDECIKEFQNTYRTHSFYICFGVYIIGEFILLFIPGQELEVIIFYILIWFIPSLIITIKAIKKGLFIWGSKSRKKIGIASFKKRVLIGSLFFGLFTAWRHLWQNGMFHPIGIVYILGAAATWGIPFYFIMTLMMSKSEKISDKELDKAEKLDS